MRPSIALEQHREDIRRIVASHRGANPRVFGSAARGEDREDSDLDLLVDYQPGMSLMDLVRIQDEVSEVTHVKVHVTTSDFRRERFKQNVLRDARAI